MQTLAGMNLVIDDALEEGINGVLDLYGHSKMSPSNSYLFLSVCLDVLKITVLNLQIRA